MEMEPKSFYIDGSCNGRKRMIMSQITRNKEEYVKDGHVYTAGSVGHIYYTHLKKAH